MIGAFKLNLIAKAPAVTAVAEVIRAKKGVTALGNAQISTAQNKFGGSSAYFDGTGDYLQIAGGFFTDFPWTYDFTWEAWVYLANTTADMALFEGQGNNNLFIRRTSANKLGIGRQLVAFDNTSTGNAVSANTWTHLAVVRSGTTLKMYSNGTEIYSGSNNQTYTLNGNCQIGASGGTTYLNGYIDEVRVSNTARYTAAFSPSTTPFINDDNTVLLLHMDGTNATTFFEDDNGIANRSPRSVISVNGAAISTTQSKFNGTSAFFDGTNDYLSVPGIDTFNTIVGDFTLECWFYSTGSGTAGDGIFSNDNGSLGAYKFAVYYEPGNTRIAWFLNNSTAIYSNTTMSVNTWYHIAFVRSGSTTKLYVNGTAQTSTSSYTGLLGYTSLWKIGNTASSYFQGYIDEVRWSKSARYTTNFTAPTTPFINDANTLLLLHMDGTNGSTVFRDDVGGRSQKGIQAIGNAQISTTQSKFGGSSAKFDGAGDIVQVSASSDFNFGTNDFTMELWMYVSSLGNGFCGFHHWDGNGNGARFGFGLTTGQFWVDTTNGLGANVNISYNTTINLNTWYHLAVVRNGNTWTSYINGAVGTSVTYAGSYLPSTSMPVSIGDFYNDYTTGYGYIDEVRVSNIARYTGAFTPSTTPFANDANTILLIHADGTNASTVFVDDNGRNQAIDSVRNWEVTKIANSTISKLVTQESFPLAISLSSDGGKMYIASNGTNTVYQYTLTTPWVVSTATYNSVSKSVSAQATGPTSIKFKQDGTKMYVQFTTSVVYQYTLSTPWVVSSATYDSKSFNIGTQGTGVREIAFSLDGTKMYSLSDTAAKVFQYTLSTAWDISTASYSSKNITVTADYENGGLDFNPNGTKMYIPSQGDTFRLYTLSTAWDVSTATYTQDIAFGTDLTVTSTYISPDGKLIYFADGGGGASNIYQFYTNA